MLRDRRLNTKGKVALSVFLTITIVLSFGLISNGEKQDNVSDFKKSLQMLTFSSEPVVAFADSTIKSIHHFKRKRRKRSCSKKRTSEAKSD